MNKILAIIFFFSFSLNAQDVNKEKLDSFLDYVELNNQDVGNISIFKNGDEIYRRSFGQKVISNLKFNKETKFHVGSITKMVTATLIWQLIEENKIRQNTKLSEYYPAIANSEKITIKNLLEHSSGLGDYLGYENGRSWIEENKSEKEIINRIRLQGLLFQPGEKIQYSNSAYYLLAKIVEKERGCTYNKALRKFIIKPLHLDISFGNVNFSKNYFKSYEYVNDWEELPELNFKNVIGVGHLLATPFTLNKFLSALFSYKLISKESLEKIIPIEKKEIFGRGMMVRNYYKKRYFGHGGTTNGTHSMTLYNIENKIAISYSINALRYSSENFLMAILEILNNEEVPYPKFFERVELNNILLNQFVGIYKDEKSDYEVQFYIKNNLLYGQATEEDSFLLEYAGNNKFIQDSEEINIEFKPSENKLILTQGGEVVIFKKIKK